MDKENEMDIFIQYKLSKHKEIPENIDNLFNNFLKEDFEMKIEEEKNSNVEKIKNTKAPKFKKMLASVASLAIIIVGGNVYASTHGYGNIFFLIKHIITGESITEKDEILSDKVLTISYTPIEIGNGMKLQVNTLEIKNNKAKLNLSIEVSDAQKIKNSDLTYVVTDAQNQELCRQNGKENVDTYYKEELMLANFKNDTTLLNLSILSGKDELIKISINLETKEILVEDNVFEKLSEVELRKYLSSFALLNYGRYDYNTNKILTALSMSYNIFDSEIPTTLSDEHSFTMFDADTVNKIVKSFENVELDKNGFMKVADDSEIKPTIQNGKKYYKQILYDSIYGFCLNINNIKYSNGIYTVEYVYCFPTGGAVDSGHVEELAQYSNTIELKINENSDYSKYFVVNNGKNPITIKEDSIVDTTIISDDINESSNSSQNTNKNETKKQENSSSTVNNEKTNTQQVSANDAWTALEEYITALGNNQLKIWTVTKNDNTNDYTATLYYYDGSMPIWEYQYGEAQKWKETAFTSNFKVDYVDGKLFVIYSELESQLSPELNTSTSTKNISAAPISTENAWDAFQEYITNYNNSKGGNQIQIWSVGKNDSIGNYTATLYYYDGSMPIWEYQYGEAQKWKETAFDVNFTVSRNGDKCYVDYCDLN